MLSFVSSCMKEDYQVYTATDGAAAMELLQREQIDLIISDVMMPGIDGFELCRQVKNNISKKLHYEFQSRVRYDALGISATGMTGDL